MGVAISRDGVDEAALKKRNNLIDAELRRESRANSKIVKLLLLGAAECGKSTILKQMRIVHSQGFEENEIRLQKSTIYENVYSAMNMMLHAMQTYGLSFENLERESDALVVKGTQKLGERQSRMEAYVVEAIKNLWGDIAVQTVFTKGNEYQLQDSAKYFLDDIDRISSLDYIPSKQDILRLRIATTGINEVEFRNKDTIYRVFDVGGQRSERRKWIHCFDNVNAVIFVAALSDFNMNLIEDSNVNRMHESVRLFESICNARWFEKTPLLLFLNKRDIFVEKISTVSIAVAYPEYSGDGSYEDTTKYIETKFQKANKIQTKEIYVHKTCATDTQDMEFVFEACFDIIYQACMLKSGLL